MPHRLIIRLMVVSIMVTVALGCSKKKADEGAAGAAGLGNTEADSKITSTPMNLTDAQGSDSGKIAGLTTVFFEYDQASLSAQTKKTLAENATWMKNNAKSVLQVEGHCDERGSIEYNLALGERRAKAVKAYLVSLGVDAKRLTTISYGKEKKIAEGDSEEAMSKNRRANFLPLGQ